MCYLRGLCYAKQNAFDRAKECYKDAVSIDVQCYEAFEQLMKNCLMSPDEEWQFLDSLDFDSIHTGSTSSSQEASEFTKMLYITRLSKYKNPQKTVYQVKGLNSVRSRVSLCTNWEGFGLYVDYSLTPLFKPGVGNDTHTLSFGCRFGF